MTNPNNVYHLGLIIAIVGLVISSAEYLAISRVFGAEGPLASRVVRFAFSNSSARRWSWAGGIVVALAFIRIAGCALALVSYVGSIAFSVGLGVAAGSHLALERRRWLGGDGSDQMNTILLCTCFLAAGPWSTRPIQYLGMVFIIAEVMLSYETSGISKLVSPAWRSGAAIPAILATATYGAPRISGILRSHAVVATGACWAVILCEMAFPLALLLPPHGLVIALAFGFLFHLSIAFLMGLNTFLWAFCATYPFVFGVVTTIRA
jgi:hypothetical protein